MSSSSCAPNPRQPLAAIAGVARDRPGAMGGRTWDRLEIRQGEISNGAIDACLEPGSAHWATPFQGSGWLTSWQAAIGEPLGATPVTVIGHHAGRTAFILPLVVLRRSGATFLTWCAYPHSDYCAPIASKEFLEACDPEEAARLLGQVADRLGTIDLVYIPKQPASIGGASNPFVLAGSVPHHAGAHAITFREGENWEASFLRRRSSKTRRRLRDKRQALERLGPVSFELARQPGEARRMVEFCLQTKAEQLRKLGHWDPFSPPDVRSFVGDYFSANVGRSTWAAALNLDGRAAAAAFGFGGGREWLLYQMAMGSGPESRFSPGTHLLLSLMQHGTEIGLKRLDLALGDEPYKAEWCDEHQTLMTSTLAFTVKGRALGHLIRLRANLNRRLASAPTLYESVKWLKGLARKIHLPR